MWAKYMADINHLPAIITYIRTIYILNLINNWLHLHKLWKILIYINYTKIFGIFFFPSLSLGATFICSRVYWTVVDQIVFFSFNFLLVLLCSWVIFNFCRVERLLCFHLFALGFLPHSLLVFFFIFFFRFHFILFLLCTRCVPGESVRVCGQRWWCVQFYN